MIKPITTIQRASAISTALLLVGLAILFYTKTWWPWLMLVIGIPLAIRQYLLGRPHDMFVSLIIFGGVFVTAQFSINWEILIPVLLITGALYILLREFLYNREPTIEEEEESINIELEEKSEKQHKRRKH